MTAHDLLLQLREKGVEVKTSGDDRLVIDAPKGTITEELRSALSAHKAELLQILKTEQARPAHAGPGEAPSSSQIVAEFAAPAERPVPAAPRVIAPVAEAPAASAAAEISRLEAEMMRLRTEEEGRRAEVEAARLAAENALRVEQERWRQQEEETARQRAQKERQRIEVEAREQAEEEHHRQIAEHELRRTEEELKRMRAMEETRRAEVDAQRLAAQAAHEAELGVLRRAEEENARQRTEHERHYLETEARKKAQEDELRRRAEMRFRAVEEEIARVQARDDARLRAIAESQRLTEDVARRRAEEEARRQAETEALRRAEEEARLRAEIEAQMRAEAAQRRHAEDAARRVAEDEARRRAEEEAQRLAVDQARRLAEAEARRQADEEARRQAEEAARMIAAAEARRQAEAHAQRQAEEESRLRGEAEVRQRAELEARIRAEIEAKIRAEEAERHQSEAARRHAEHERILAEEAAKAHSRPEFGFEIERVDVEQPSATHAETSNVTEVAEWFDLDVENRDSARAIEPAPLTYPDDHFGTMQDDAGGEFAAVSVPDSNFIAEGSSSLHSEKPAERAAAVSDLPHFGGEEAFQQVSAAFDDQSVEVRNAAAKAMSELQEDRAAAFTRALREASPERRRKIGSAIASSGLANEAIRNLTGESRDKTYDAFSLLFLMSKAGELQPLMRAIEENANIEVRLAVVKLLALSGQPDILPAFRRMAVRGTLPAEVRSAIMEAIYQITSQSPAEAPSMS
jgi:TubC N-terminal docking domain